MRGKKASPGVRNSPLCQREMKLKPRLVCATVVAPHCRSQARSRPEEEPTLLKAGAKGSCQHGLCEWGRQRGKVPVTTPSSGTASQAQLLGGLEDRRQEHSAGQGMLMVKEETQVPQAHSPKAQTQHLGSCKGSVTMTKTLLQEWPWSHALPRLQRPLSSGIPDVEIQSLAM